MLVHVLLYEAGTESEGIHSLELKGKTVILLRAYLGGQHIHAGNKKSIESNEPPVRLLTQ